MTKRSPVLKNTLILVGAQLAGTPLTILVNAVIARYLGAEAFGYMFLASTLARLGFLFVEWGHNGVLPAEVARDRSRAGELLGTSIAWRLAASVIVGSILALGSWLLGYGMSFQLVLFLTSLQWVLNTTALAYQDVVKGFERTDIAAASQLLGQLLALLIVVPTLLLGGKLNATLAGQAAVAAIALGFVVWVTRRVGIGSVSITRRALHDLSSQGSYFLTFSIAMALQANVDTVLLSKLAPSEVVGWQAAALRLTGVLVIPASALVSALYPTLSRLHAESPPEFAETTRRAVRGTVLLAVPIAVCCALYRDVGIQIFSKKDFGPANQNLLVYSVFILLVYVSMPLGTAILAAGRQRAWAAVQMLCVAVSLSLDPLLIPWFQRHYGNGGIGVATAALVSETLMVSAGVFMVGKTVLDRSLFVAVMKAAVAGGVMLALGALLWPVTPYVAAPVVSVAYVAALWLIGGVSREELERVKGAVLRRVRR